MCTALTFQTKEHYFGRNLDLEYSYNETVTITPRNFPLTFHKAKTIKQHYAMIGIAYVVNDYPLYYDAVNEKGLAMAGLNFPDNATYYKEVSGKDNITPFEFIPWILGQCATIEQAKDILAKINLLDEAFSENLPLSPLHWLIADKNKAITVEAMSDGIKVYDNHVGVLANNPPFDFMMTYLTNFRNLTAEHSLNSFSEKLELPPYCQGMGAIGLPGDYSSASRFVKTAFVKWNSILPYVEANKSEVAEIDCSGEYEFNPIAKKEISDNEVYKEITGDSQEQEEITSVSQFFHILSSVEMPRGSVRLENGKSDITVYSSCCNQDTGVYYYTTYDNRQISAVAMHQEDLDSDKLSSYPLLRTQNIFRQNIK